ncbi:hypothetical protein Adt_44927 [Abeliophyllum distichum]|uniref:Uncharacterized protein n=1 Tax=Abeliophyllum distichum TaxID=126358 RepID=A0ABD1PC83_9LAMI
MKERVAPKPASKVSLALFLAEVNRSVAVNASAVSVVVAALEYASEDRRAAKRKEIEELVDEECYTSESDDSDSDFYDGLELEKQSPMMFYFLPFMNSKMIC